MMYDFDKILNIARPMIFDDLGPTYLSEYIYFTYNVQFLGVILDLHTLKSNIIIIDVL